MFRNPLGLAVVFLVIALVAGLFSFGIGSAESWQLAKIFFVFVVLAVLTFVGGFCVRRRHV